MSEQTFESDRLIHGVLLDMLTRDTGLPSTVISWRGEEEVRWSSEETGRVQSRYCTAISRFEAGCARCVRDQCDNVRTLQEPILGLCHAGLYNYIVPIRIGNQVREALVLGQMRLQGSQFETRSSLNHEALMHKLAVDDESERRIRDLFTENPTLNADQLGKALEMARLIGQWYSVLRGKELDLEAGVERVTHELQIRLQAVFALAGNLCVDLQNTSKVTKDTRIAVNQLLRSIVALDVVIQNFGDFVGEYRFSLRPIALLIHNSRDLYEAEARNKGVVLNVKLEMVEGGQPKLWVSERHIQQVLHNLVHNAVKYSYRGAHDRPRYVDIRGTREGPYYRLDIQNYGVGILRHEYDKIFIPGYQGELTEGEYRTGSGRGLYFARRVVEAHGGRITVESRQQNSGWLTTFRVYLPFEQTGRQGE